ncbi:hypothetical protein TRAPUB_13174 [Trametes pubescens]|uniref:F-box domain-containing protein n=1 Tax=Trametes pubescens TaxID=154538 RepID=A0A1M2VRV2_TRAPU|nr:hypothetical protein TRAPUB_13174 [Trametes pubescens]
MNTLPLEVIQNMFALACTDGGRTGCSLSLTPKTIRAVARSTRFHSVFLDAFYSNRLYSFMSTYEAHCRPLHGSRPRVKHLYLTLGIHGIPSDFPSSGIAAPIESPDPAPWPLADDVGALLRAVSADILSLVIQVFPNGYAGAAPTPDVPTLGCTFPSLRELTVFGTSDPRSFFSGVSAPAMFPSLRRLHIVDANTIYRQFRDQNLDPWTMHAPEMTHLRISNLSLRESPGLGGIPVQLAAQMGIPVDDEDEGKSVEESWPRPDDCPPKMHSHLRHIVIQPCIRPSGRLGAATSYRSGELLRKLAQYPSYVDLKFVVLAPPKQPGIPAWWTKSMKAQWLERIEGGVGCWVDAEEDSAEDEGWERPNEFLSVGTEIRT